MSVGRLRRWIVRRTLADRVDAELSFHVEMRARELIAAGMPEADARRVAAERFDRLDDIAAECRRIGAATERSGRRFEYLRGVRDDLRFAARQLVRAPAFTTGVIVTLALGLGLGGTVFSLLDGIFLRWPAGVQAPATIRRVWLVDHRGPAGSAYATTDLDYPGFAALGGARPEIPTALYTVSTDLSIVDGPAAFDARVAYATAAFFPLTGTHPLRGRFYTPGEDRMGAASPVMVVSERFWHRALGGAPDVLGKTLRAGNVAYTIIGVAAPGFDGVDVEPVDVWVPFGGYPGVGVGTAPWWEERNFSGFQMLLRLPPGTSAARINAALTAALHRSDATSGASDSTLTAVAGSLILARGPASAGRELAIALRLGAVAAVLLLIVSANVLSLMLARAIRRRREVAVRLALGIRRGRLLRLLLAETLLLSAVAGAAAIVVALWGGQFLRAVLFPDMRWAQPVLHWHLFAFAGLSAALIALTTGTLPSLRLLSQPLAIGLRGDARAGQVPHGRLRHFMVVMQTALSTVLVAGAALFLQSLHNVEQIDVGYEADHLVYASAQPRGLYDPAVLHQQTARAERVLTSQPGVADVYRVSRIPLEFGGFGIPWFAGTDSMGSRAGFRPTVSRVTPGYLAGAGVRFIAGHDVTGDERGIVVNRTLAAALWPQRSPIGACLQLGRREHPCHVVVGVVQDGKRSSIVETPQPQYFVADADHEDDGIPSADVLTIRVDPSRRAAVAAAAQRLLGSAIPDARIRVVSLAETLAAQYRPWQLGAILFTIFGALALLVAMIGVYSTVSYTVAQRTRDLGIRAALGASAREIVSHVLRGALRPVGAGVIAGVILALASRRVVAALLYGVGPSNPATLAGTASLLIGIAALAALAPAWRAAKVDPVVALGSEP